MKKALLTPWLQIGAACLILMVPASAAWADASRPDAAALRDLAQQLKNDPRGPYQAILWFCPDGQILPAKSRCPEPGGLQHAVVKDEVGRLATEQNLFWGQILAGGNYEAFWAEGQQHTRIKQYQLGKYLEAADVAP